MVNCKIIDILFNFLGREFFVGLSKWTNEAGAKAVAAAFPEYPCVPIKVIIDNVYFFQISFVIGNAT